MATDRQKTGLTILRILLGVFFLFQGIGKLRWFVDASILGGQLSGWLHGLRPESLSAHYLERVAIPFTWLFARLVPLGEMGSGLALILGFWTPVAASLAFLIVLNFHVASGAIFTYGFLTNGYGLPVLGGTLALALATPRKSKGKIQK